MSEKEKEVQLLHALSNIDDAYIEEAVHYADKKSKWLFSRQFKLAFAMAVCLIAVLFTVQIQNFNHPNDNMTAEYSYQEVNSLQEASAITGFTLQLPSEYEIKTVSVISKSTIEVYMTNDNNNTICIRKAEGTEDISGDYNSYPSEMNVMVNNTQVTLKGDEDQWSLAIWSSDGYAYALSIQDGTYTTEQMQKLVLEIQ